MIIYYIYRVCVCGIGNTIIIRSVRLVRTIRYRCVYLYKVNVCVTTKVFILYVFTQTFHGPADVKYIRRENVPAVVDENQSSLLFRTYGQILTVQFKFRKFAINLFTLSFRDLCVEKIFSYSCLIMQFF